MFASSVKPAGQSSIFGGGGGSSSVFGQSLSGGAQQTQQPQSQQTAPPTLGQSQALPLGNSTWEPGSLTPYQKSIPEQIRLIMEKWVPNNPNCVFRHYFYNKVEQARIPFYQPGPNEDPKEWEEALQNKPAPDFMPVLCSGFVALSQRLMVQRHVLAQFNITLHDINRCLDAILSNHDLETSVRALNARRRHAALHKRALVLAAKVQVLRNRGYAMSGDEDDLQQKLQEIERGIQDPALSARMEELWSRLITLRAYADRLQAEINSRGLGESEGLGEEVEAKAKKILEDYEKQLQHLKKEVELIKKDFEDWEKEHNPAPAAAPR